MRRSLSAFVMLCLLVGQAAPGVCSLAAGHDGSADHDGRHERPAAHTHAHHVAEQRAADNGAAVHGAVARSADSDAAPAVPLNHDGACPDLTRCHWSAVPAAEAARLTVRSASVEPQVRHHAALDAVSPALRTPPPKSHS